MKVTEQELKKIIKEECVRALNIIKENRMLTEKFSPEVAREIARNGGLKNDSIYDARNSNHLDNPLDKAEFKGILDASVAAKLKELELFKYIQNYVLELGNGNYIVLEGSIEDYVDMKSKQLDRDEKYYNDNIAGTDYAPTFTDVSNKTALGDVTSSLRAKKHKENNNH